MGSCIQPHLPNPNFLPFYSVNRSQEVTLRQYVQKLSILCIVFETFSLLIHNITLSPKKAAIKIRLWLFFKKKEELYLNRKKQNKTTNHLCTKFSSVHIGLFSLLR